MLRLPLYKDGRAQWSAVELSTALDRDAYEAVGRLDQGRACDRCNLSANKKLQNPCLPADGAPGGLLVVGDAATKFEDMQGTSFYHDIGRKFRLSVKQHWTGPVAYDNAIKCWPAGTKVVEKHIKKCRGFLHGTIAEVRPTRILSVGPNASLSLFGRGVPPLATRRGYSFLRGGKLGGKPIPVFFLPPPWYAARNHFVRKWLESDLQWALTTDAPTRGPWKAHAHVIETLDDALQAERDIMTNDWVAFDVETMGLMWNPEFIVISVALCGDGDEEPYVWDERALYDPRTREVLARILTSKKIAKCGSNVKYDQLAMRAAFGIVTRPIKGDTRLSRKLLDPEASGKLAVMAELVGMGGLKQDAQVEMNEIKKRVKAACKKQWHPKKPVALSRASILPDVTLHPEIERVMRACTNALEVDEVAERYQYGMLNHAQLVSYNARDSVATARLEHKLMADLDAAPPLRRMWDAVVRPASVALERVEAWGVGASTNAIMAFDSFLEAREIELKKTLDQYPGVNWDAPDQVSKLFFASTANGGLGLPSVKKTKSGLKESTDAEVLELLKNHHPLPAALLDYRFVTKMRGTYASGMLPHVRADGRIHPNIKLDGARSGRTSCTDPNLQNIPRAQTDEGKMARDCFIAPPGKKLLEVDYSQLELRIACMLSGDDVMLQIFKSGVDYHLRTAQLVSQLAWGIAPEKVEDSHRSKAKNVNFGVLYGKTAVTFADEWSISKRKAQMIVDAIMGNFKKLQAWCARQELEATRTGEVWTWWAGQKARVRPLFRIADTGDSKSASVAKNGARNSPVQGTASEFCVASLTESVNWIEEDGIEDDVKLILAVHDSLLFEVSEHMVDETALTVNEIMTGWDSQDVPLVVDFKIGDSWGSMEKYKLPGQKKAA